MLNENQVVEGVCGYLESTDMTIVSKCSTKEQGYDIVARYPNSDRLLVVEAKGATSARESSARFEKGFTQNQVRSHVARAFYAAAATLQREKGNADAAIALPDTRKHKGFIEAIAQPLDLLGIKVFWVNDAGVVDTEN